MSFWRMEEPIMGEDGRVAKGGMYSHQRAIWESESYIKLLVGGYGAGKTMTCAKRAIWLGIKNSPVPIMIISPSYKVARRTIIPTIKRLLTGRKIKFIYRVQDAEFSYSYKGRECIIWVGSGDNADALKGPNLAAALIDEPFIQPVEVFEQMMARVRDPMASHRELCLFGTPEQLNWGYDISEGKHAHKYDLELIRAKSTDNKSLPPEFIKHLRNSCSPEMREAYMNGEFVNLGKGTIYYAFKRATHVKDFGIPPEAMIQVGMDFNVNPMSAVLFYEYNECTYIIDELELPNSNTQYMAEMIHERIKQYQPKQTGWVKVFPDPAGNQRKTSAPVGTTDLTILEQNGFTVFAHSKTKSVRDTYNAVNKRLDDGHLIVHTRCSALIDGFERLNFEEFKKLAEYTHMTDALKYPIHYLHPIEIIKPYTTSFINF